MYKACSYVTITYCVPILHLLQMCSKMRSKFAMRYLDCSLTFNLASSMTSSYAIIVSHASALCAHAFLFTFTRWPVLGSAGDESGSVRLQDTSVAAPSLVDLLLADLMTPVASGASSRLPEPGEPPAPI